MIACSVNKVSKNYGGTTIFEEISFEIHENDRVGLVGRNGSGKTTLFHLMAGADQPDSGQIHWKKGTKIGYLEQIPSFNKDVLTIDYLKTAFVDLLQMEKEIERLEQVMGDPRNENNLEKLINEYGVIQDQFALKGGYEMDASIEKIVYGLSIESFLDKPLSSLSGGEKTKAGLAHMLLNQPDLLLLDEPTNHLDLMAVEWLGTFLKSYPGTIVIISHDRYFLDEVANKILDLEDGEIQMYPTNFSGFVKAKEERLLKEFQAYEVQQKKIKKMKEAIKRLREWANRANPPNEGLHKRARNMERALERMEKLNRPVLLRKKMNLEMDSADRSGKDVIAITGVSKAFADKPLFKNVEMLVRYQEHVAIVGENGSGKSTLIKMILGQCEVDEGHIRIGSNVKVGYLSQQIFSDSKNETVMETFRNDVKVTEEEARKILARFLFYGHMVFRKVSQLSGGERMRLRLAQMMYQDINLYILDEPTNHLDIESREVLEEVLEDYNGTVIAVSHDRYFLNRLFEKIYWIENQTLHGFEGNYNWAKEKMGEIQSKREFQNEPVKERDVIPSEKPKQKMKNQYENLQHDLDVIEKELIELEEKLAESSDWNRLQHLYQTKVALEEKWRELVEKIE